MDDPVDIKMTHVVRRSPIYRITTPNVAIAKGVTRDGREIQGVGVSLLSEDTALDAAVENLKEHAREVDFSFSISVLEGGNLGGRIEIYDEGVKQRPGSSFGRPAVEINATRDGHAVDARGNTGLLGNAGLSPSFDTALSSALDSAESQFDRVGHTSV